MICKNCEQSFEGNFCGNCGQKSNVKRINFEYLINQIPDSIFQINHGFLFTVKQLTTRPGHSIREFLNGKRKPYYKPIAFFLITSTIYLLIGYLFNRISFLDELLSGFMEGVKFDDESTGLTVLNWLSKNQTYLILFFLPLYSFATYLAFIKSKYNYYEHLVINLYITSYQLIIYLILGLVFYKDNILLLIPLIIGIIYNFWSFSQLFENKKVLNKIWLIISSYITFILLIIVPSIIVVVIINIIM